MVYLISYRLYRPGQNYPGLDAAIKGISGIWLHHTTSAWLVQTNLSAEQIFNRLSPFIDANDEMVVLRLQGDGWVSLKDQVGAKWLKERVY